MPKTGGKSEDDSDVKGVDVPTLEPVKMPEADMLSIENAKYADIFLNIISLLM